MKTVGLIINPLPLNIPKKENKSNTKKPAPKPPKAKILPKETEPSEATTEEKVPENGAD